MPEKTDPVLEHYNQNPGKVYLVLCLLSFGYFGKYFCTSNLYVTKQLIIDGQGISASNMAFMLAFGYFASMFGKASAAYLCETNGGKFTMSVAAIGYSISCIVFTFVPPNMYWLSFALWLVVGYFALGISWVSVTAVANKWVPSSHKGRLMAYVNVAPQLGDAIARAILSGFILFGWKAVWYVASAFGFGLMLPVWLVVGENPPSVEAAEKKEKKDDGKPKPSWLEKTTPLFKKPSLWMTSMVSGSLYGTRAIFLLYAVEFLAAIYCNHQDLKKYDDGMEGCLKDKNTLALTGWASMSYTIMGCISVFIVGYLKDTLPKKHAASVLCLPSILLFLVMGYLTINGTNVSVAVGVSIVGATGFLLFGPYKILGSVFAADIGGKEMQPTATSLMGTFDNFFAMVMVIVKGYITDWNTNFALMTGLAVITTACATGLWVRDLKASAREVSNPSGGDLYMPLDCGSDNLQQVLA